MANATVGRSKLRKGAGIQFSLNRFCRDLGLSVGFEFLDPGKLRDRPVDFTSGRVAAVSYLFSEMLSKYDDGKPSPDKERTTWERFREAEDLCRTTNRRLAGGRLFDPLFPEIRLGAEIASKILGPFDWDRCERFMGFGPGASTQLTRRHSAAAYKYSGIPESTIGNAILGTVCIKRNPVWEQTVLNCEESPDIGLVKVVPGNRIVTVPKNYKTDRTIAIEPRMNMFVQKGIGGLMRERLRLAGCSLNDQSLNQTLAGLGSRFDVLATVDLSMASDTVSREVVSQYIRADWLEALEQARCPFGILPSGEKIFYQKFSSMGNGYTFELESLLFYSLALAVVRTCGEEESSVSVYGDDIIMPSSCTERFLEVISFVGFKPNGKKTFFSGPFRESCGKHFFCGTEITPFYIRKPVATLDRLFLLHNNLWRWLERVRTVIGEEESGNVERLLASLRHLAPSRWRRPRIPDGYGDGAFIGHSSTIELTPDPSGWEFWNAHVLVQLATEQECDVPGLMVHGLSILERRDPPGHMDYMYPRPEQRVQPTEVAGYKEMKILIPQYPLASNG